MTASALLEFIFNFTSSKTSFNKMQVKASTTLSSIAGFVGGAFAKVVDQWWNTSTDCNDSETFTDADRDQDILSHDLNVFHGNVRKKSVEKRSKQRKLNTKNDIVKNVECNPSWECVSNSSTCGSSEDEEENETDTIGDKEMKLMMERALEIKRLPKQRKIKGSRQRTKSMKSKTIPEKNANHTSQITPLKLQNTTNSLWRWSVYSGFQVDTVAIFCPSTSVSHEFNRYFLQDENLEQKHVYENLVENVLS